MRVSLLADCPHLAAQLVSPFLSEWGWANPDETADDRFARFRSYMNRDRLPVGWIATDADAAMGIAALREHDLPGREDLTPWLATVFVRPEYRRRGAASALCLTVEEGAQRLGADHLYLFTVDKQQLYKKLGWRSFDRGEWMGHQVEIMTKNLSD